MLDAWGQRHDPVAEPPRIACLVPSITELLFDLGLGDRVVARTGFCIHPDPQVRNVTKVGGTKDVNPKRLLALRPTHLIVNIDENRREIVELLRPYIPHVIVTHPCIPEDNLSLYALLGHVFRAESSAEQIAQRFQQAMSRAKALASRWPTEPVLYLIWKDPWMTVARSTYISAMLALVGWRTLPDVVEPRYPVLSEEDTSWHAAKRIFLSSEPYRFSEQDRVDLRQRLGSSHAHICLIDGEMASWYGSRAIAGIDYLVRLRCETPFWDASVIRS